MARRNISLKQYTRLAEQLVKKIQQEVPPFKDVSTAAKAERKKRAGEDLEFLCKTYFPHHFNGPFEQKHREAIQAMQRVHEKTVHLHGFRGVGKSTLGEVGYGAQCVLFQLTRYLPVISDTDDQAMLLILPLKVELEENPRIRADFGEMKGIEWGEDAFVTKNGVKVEANSWRSFKRGRKYLQYRPKRIFVDDLENLESVKNKRNTDKREDALFGDILNAMDLKAGDWQLLVLTNKLGRDDMAGRLIKNKAVHTVLMPAEKENGHAMHPKSFPKKVLNKIKDTIGAVRYAREFLLKIISSEEDDFQEDWFVWLDRPAGRYKYIVMACDPSVGNTEGHDTKAWIVMGLTADEKHVDILHAWIRRTTIYSMCKQGFELHQRYNPHKSSFESNGFQILIRDKLQSMAKDEGYGFGLISSILPMQNNAPKNTRILRLQTGIKTGFYRFVKGSDMRRLADQFLGFDSSVITNTDDGPDAAEMGNRLLRRLNGEIGTADAEVIY